MAVSLGSDKSLQSKKLPVDRCSYEACRDMENVEEYATWNILKGRTTVKDKPSSPAGVISRTLKARFKV